ncbi:MAG TPA: DivIVA domain-containing protein [Nocardioidaceae bacterium]|nr:DivIVA domain-containing protein [Nocardioidaceae bacterium]
MTWFFAVLVVLVLGAVAVVAAGRGGTMAEVHDDRPDVRVQADGPLTAQDLRRVRFSTAFRGYRMSEVDVLLDRLAAELAVPREPARAADAQPAAEPAVDPAPEPEPEPESEPEPGPEPAADPRERGIGS